ncbi:MAG: FimV/HubP family polar landmark protein [Burkholderiaceae bacterium]
MRAGATLEIPSAAEMADVSVAQAREEIVRGNQVFRDYRARIAERTREAQALAQSPASPSATAAVGQIGEAPKPILETRPSGDQLELSREGPAAGSGVAPVSSTGSSDAAEKTESQIARDIALRNAQERVSELERNVNDLQRLLELKNRQLAELGSAEQAAPAERSSESTAAMTAATTPMTVTVAPTEVAPAPAAVVQPSVTESQPPAAASETETAPAPAAESTPLQARAGEALDRARQVAEPVEQKPALNESESAAESTAEPTESLLDTVKNQVLGNPYVPAGVAVLLALAGLFAWKRRRSADPADQIEDTLGGDDAFTSNSLFGTTGGQDVDTSNSLFGSVAADSESSVDVHSTEVDPIAEAEVYIAYGREAQAEEILKEALKRQPERQAIRLKLLEIYAGRKDATTFAHLAREMYDQSGGQNEEWPKVITMGLAIDHDNPLYTGDANTVIGSAQPAAGAAAAAVAHQVSAQSAGSEARSASRMDTSLADADSMVDELEGVLSQSGPGSIAGSTGSAGSGPLADDALAQDTLARVEDELGALDFDLDTRASAEPSLSASTESLDTDTLDVPSLSLDLDADTPSMSMSFDTGTESGLALESDVAITSDDMSDLGLDIPSIDTLSGATAADTPEVDLSSIGLDLAPNDDAAPLEASGDGARWQEMATKLDLASAYEEIGDREGARELLEEVLKGGDNSQQQKARAMLSKIS